MIDPILKAFGNHLRELRKQKGISQEQLAELTGLHRTYLGGVERGVRNPTLLTISKIAKALHLSISEILKFR